MAALALLHTFMEPPAGVLTEDVFLTEGPLDIHSLPVALLLAPGALAVEEGGGIADAAGAPRFLRIDFWGALLRFR